MGNQTASGLSVLIKSVLYKIFGWPTIMCGVNPSGDPVPMQTDATGNVIIAGVIPVTPQTVTRVPFSIGASGTQAIPIGAKGYSFSVITGTAGDGTVTGMPAGYSQGDPNTLVAGFTLTTQSASSVLGYYNT